MAIFTYVCSTMLAVVAAVNGMAAPRTCDAQQEKGYYYDCIRKWELTDEIVQQTSAYLRKPHLYDDICTSKPGVSVRDVDKCVIERVSPWCDVIHGSWKAYKKQVETICTYKNDFVHTHRQCRTKPLFLMAYDQCYEGFHSTKSSMPVCTCYKNLLGCLENALAVYCPADSRLFFTMIFRASLDYHIEFTCHHHTTEAPKPDKIINPIDDSGIYEDYYDYESSRLALLDDNNDTRENTKMHEVNFSEKSVSATNGSSNHGTYIWALIYSVIFILLR